MAPVGPQPHTMTSVVSGRPFSAMVSRLVNRKVGLARRQRPEISKFVWQFISWPHRSLCGDFAGQRGTLRVVVAGKDLPQNLNKTDTSKTSNQRDRQHQRINHSLSTKMPNWTHLIRFRAIEDGQVHLGQLVDTSRDVGIDCLNGVEVKAFLINGDIFNGTVTNNVFTVDHVSYKFSSRLRRG
jgi:hypothetical protein